jgi:hypothetical protein
VVVDGEGLAAGARQGCPGAAGAVADPVAVEVGEAALTGAQGGRQVCAGAGDADAVAVEVGEAVPVAEGTGTQVMARVGVGVGAAGLDVVGWGSVGVGVEVVGADVGRMVTLGQGVTTGFGAVALAGVEAGRGTAGLTGAGLRCCFATAAVREATVVALAGARSEAGSALTPCRYASAMAVTMLA